MTSEDLESFESSLTEKLGQENVSMIADNIGELRSKSLNSQETILNQEKEIEKLKNEKERLVLANGKLLQQIPMEKDDDVRNKETEPKKAFSFREQFDEKGNFIK